MLLQFLAGLGVAVLHGRRHGGAEVQRTGDLRTGKVLLEHADRPASVLPVGYAERIGGFRGRMHPDGYVLSAG